MKRCGKSRLVDVVAETCHAPLITVNATIAAVVRSIGQDPPTLLVDEADTLWGTKKQADQNEDLRDRLTAWAREHLPKLQHAAPVMPLEDRAADTWEPLIATADLAAGDWPDRARAAATIMTEAESQQEEDTSLGPRLLADLRDLFDQAGADTLYTTTILERLHKIDDAPWADWYGHPLTTRDLAKLLR